MRHILPLLLLFLAGQISAQRRDHPHLLEAGLMLGIAGYSGDLSAKRTDLQEVRPSYGAFARYQLGEHFAVKGHLYAGAISGDDKYSEVKAPRSFKFGASLFEVAATLEWRLFSRDRFSNTGIYLTPYAFAGIAYTFVDADVQYYGPPDQRGKFVLTPIPEEGLKSRYLLAPVGGGILVDFYEGFLLGLEGGVRPAFSDGIDGVSLNGNPKENDWYYFLGATLSFVLNGHKAGG